MSVKLEEKTAAALGDAPRAEYRVLHDDDKTCITQWRFRPGDQTGWHRHEWDYVTVQQSGGRLRLEGADGTERFIDYQEGRAISFSAPIEHNATNVGDVEVRVLEIEYKR
jgi:quercetin dioxygenase-like cupin family protein